ncbi:hypothetical protein EYF80_050358 [Liparis tanakae]|uniref:Uncharacterized protein n=1 Tax=Liparis tanakae TaxID=230148 RepID=A0A4Z2FEV4_9TELE|nr:hypothetical protein EYF80_050358 [Liparis tanakae]
MRIEKLITLHRVTPIDLVLTAISQRNADGRRRRRRRSDREEEKRPRGGGATARRRRSDREEEEEERPRRGGGATARRRKSDREDPGGGGATARIQEEEDRWTPSEENPLAVRRGGTTGEASSAAPVGFEASSSAERPGLRL